MTITTCDQSLCNKSGNLILDSKLIYFILFLISIANRILWKMKINKIVNNKNKKKSWNPKFSFLSLSILLNATNNSTNHITGLQSQLQSGSVIGWNISRSRVGIISVALALPQTDWRTNVLSRYFHAQSRSSRLKSKRRIY